ncbi:MULTISPECIES: universal stress protein [Haloferax]|uniref:Universal stress protein n=2 Tax=Haloferax TaxID=2251 RepID=A0A6G1Z0J3_9EURY|nr:MULTISPECIES: universal stress protein [Haloferax]KAB1187457.1 universal stress protein [Haloferax sp. CBA1149]MRW80109.1 universal stress protein [Haloferax marinisediminis]
MYDAILFPTDGSEGSERAREHALALAADQHATLHVLNVVEATAPGASLHELVADNLRELGEGIVSEVAEMGTDRGIDVETTVVEGDPARTIVAYAESNDIDVIVMPTHGRPELTKAIVGSVTDKVIRTGDVPVTVVKLAE